MDKFVSCPCGDNDGIFCSLPGCPYTPPIRRDAARADLPYLSKTVAPQPIDAAKPGMQIIAHEPMYGWLIVSKQDDGTFLQKTSGNFWMDVPAYVKFTHFLPYPGSLPVLVESTPEPGSQASASTATPIAWLGPGLLKGSKYRAMTESQKDQWVSAFSELEVFPVFAHLPEARVDVDALAASIVTAACELDGPADPAGDDTISITMKDLEAVVHRHVTAALESQ